MIRNGYSLHYPACAIYPQPEPITALQDFAHGLRVGAGVFAAVVLGLATLALLGAL